MKKLIFLLVAIFALSAGMALAQEDVNASDLGIEEPTLLPDSPFYFLKEWQRGIGNFFTFDPVKKAERELNQANERLIEIKKLAEKEGTEDVVDRAVEKYEQTSAKVAERIEAVKEEQKDNPRFQEIVDKFTENGITQSRLISNLRERYENAPEEIKEKIEAVRERTEERVGIILEKIDADNVAQRLERVLQKDETNSEDIDSGQIETLRRVQLKLREKLPEAAEADEIINNVIERRVESVQERVEKQHLEEENGENKTTSADEDESIETSTSLANPAAEYCLRKGGKLERYKTADGEDAYCLLPDGLKCRQWDFFRGECEATNASALDQIKVRKLQPVQIKALSPMPSVSNSSTE